MYYCRSCSTPAAPRFHAVTVNFWDSRGAAIREEVLREKEIAMSSLRSAGFGLPVGVMPPKPTEAAWFVYHAVARALIDNFLATDISAESHEAFINSVLSLLERDCAQKGVNSMRRIFGIGLLAILILAAACTAPPPAIRWW